MDGTEISVPNQEFLNKGLINLGQKSHITTRSIVFGFDYKLDPEMIMNEITILALENPNVEKPREGEQDTSSGTSKILVGISKLALDNDDKEQDMGAKGACDKIS